MAANSPSTASRMAAKWARHRFAAFVAYKGLQIADKSEKMTQWYEDNNEAVLFGRYLRVNENDRWRFWHDKWGNDPGLKEDMNDYFQMEEWKENKKK